MTPLHRRLLAEIDAAGPIGIDRYMELALGDPQHGYYTTRDPFGSAGDFTTAPEISQVFGEVVAAWLVDRWRAMGAPDPVLLVELGPGRGTLMADILRAARVDPGCAAALDPHLVETSPILRALQQWTLAAHRVAWHDTLKTVPHAPMLLVANEFFDALPVRQWRRSRTGWRERCVGRDGSGALAVMDRAGGQPAFPPPSPEPPSAIFETCEPGVAVAREIGRRLAGDSGAALVIDYGHVGPSWGDTLQAVRSHRYVGILDDPGEADLTAHVDFSALAGGFRAGGAATWGPVTQGEFLEQNGALLRGAALGRRATPEAAAEIRTGVARLVAPEGMGTLFKVLAATSPSSAAPAGF